MICLQNTKFRLVQWSGFSLYIFPLFWSTDSSQICIDTSTFSKIRENPWYIHVISINFIYPIYFHELWMNQSINPWIFPWPRKICVALQYMSIFCRFLTLSNMMAIKKYSKENHGEMYIWITWICSPGIPNFFSKTIHFIDSPAMVDFPVK